MRKQYFVILIISNFSCSINLCLLSVKMIFVLYKPNPCISRTLHYMQHTIYYFFAFLYWQKLLCKQKNNKDIKRNNGRCTQTNLHFFFILIFESINDDFSVNLKMRWSRFIWGKFEAKAIYSYIQHQKFFWTQFLKFCFSNVFKRSW